VYNPTTVQAWHCQDASSGRISFLDKFNPMELQSFEKPYVTLLKSANRAYKQPLLLKPFIEVEGIL
jgi:hypothetical protein